ncbi:MAG: tripartite tricarboxylate transporter TctB family protein [Syntrophaceae bacterium]|nr:tripartite tricarboxylate transporter TctB family protein [Syntrophaceae bacterium]
MNRPYLLIAPFRGDGGVSMASASMKKADMLVSLIIIPICLYVFYESGNWPKQALIGAPTLIPWGVAACLLMAAGMQFVRALAGKSLPLEERLTGSNRRRVIFAALLTGGYAALVSYGGFLITTFLYLALFSLAAGERRWIRLIVFAVTVPVAIYLIFAAILNVPLPPGIFR